MIFRDARERLVHFRGDFPAKPLDARRIAGLLDAPGCMRRQVIDAASVPMKDLAPLIGCREPRQSSYALQRGVRFEQSVTSNAMSFLLPLVREQLALDVREVREQDLSTVQVRTQFPDLDRDALTDHRVRTTRDSVAQMLAGDQRAINLLRHPYLVLTLGDMPTYLEPDLLAYAASGTLAPIEIKSFPCIDGIADPAKTAEAARQTAVYMVALCRLVENLGQPSSRIASQGLLVMTRDFTLEASGSLLDLRPQVRRLERVLANFPHVTQLAAQIPTAVSLPALPSRDTSQTERTAASAQAREAVGALPMRFGDGCTGCPLLDFCRGQAQREESVAQLGTQAANMCGDVSTVSHALALTAGTRTPTTAAEKAVAEELRRAAIAVQLAGAAA
ncbi:hypothetical protein ND748_00265 [Frankia sp. AiPs1]|uniref:hypothetical protein n=1 Tax=Frankia sp. AiPs1 TaxID=573493 RepID=UPI0020449807|nr:hypothetical protein [Frankia sp. AiPs1]MCM3920130.1 hypothetical protein [Frankia sp. AiPs1]